SKSRQRTTEHGPDLPSMLRGRHTWPGRAKGRRRETERAAPMERPSVFPSVARPVAIETYRPRVTRLSGRLLPERTIRRGHATVETTRHRITSFQFVEHAPNVGPNLPQCKSRCAPPHGRRC